jgi:hypothetical protein
MIPLDALLLGFSREGLDLRANLRRGGRISCGWVRGHGRRSHPCALESRAKESDCRGAVTVLREEHCDHLPVLIHGPVDIPPAPGDFHVRFVHAPARADTVPVRLRGPRIQRSTFLDLSEDGGSVHWDESLGQPFHHIRLTEAKAETPAPGPTHDGGRKGRTRKGSPGPRGERAAAVGTTMPLGAVSNTALLKKRVTLTMRT